MLVIKSLALVLLVTVLVTKSRGDKCCNPDQFEAKAYAISEEIFDGKRTITTDAMSISYDYTNNQMVAIEIQNVTDGITTWRTKSLFKNNKLYFANLEQQTCKVLQFGPMMRNCIPDDAVDTGTRAMGGGSKTFIATSYKYATTVPKGTAYATVTQDTCAYVTQALYGILAGGPVVMESTEYFNATLGIRDPNVFDIPSYCPKSDHLNVEHLIKGNILVRRMQQSHHF